MSTNGSLIAKNITETNIELVLLFISDLTLPLAPLMVHLSHTNDAH